MSEKKSFLDTISAEEKPESFAEETFQTVDRGNKKKLITGIVSAAVILAGAFAIYYFTSRVTMPDLVGKTLVEATDWATKNDVTLYAKSVYSLEAEADTVVSQATAAGQSVKKNTTVTIEISEGADPEEVIVFPDIESMTLDEIDTWIADNQLTGATETTEYSDIVAEDMVIRYSFTDGSADNFKRKNRVTIVVSLGVEALSDTVTVTDFSSMKTAEILAWGTENSVAITLEEAYDNYISAGAVVSQSVKANAEMLRTNTITVVISLGKSITMPDLSAMTKEDANAWAKENNITLTVTEKYSDTKTKGALYAQDIASGSSIVAGDTVKVSCSLGKVQLSSFIGKTKLDILNWQVDVNAKYASVKLTFSEACGEKGSVGKILGQSVQNDYVSTSATINIVISKGMKVAIPDFSWKTQAECSALANSAGISILFDYQDSDTIARGVVISQSVAKDTVTTDAQPVTIVISIKD
jgi:serine/threonine-protein kinase